MATTRAFSFAQNPGWVAAQPGNWSPLTQSTDLATSGNVLLRSQAYAQPALVFVGQRHLRTPPPAEGPGTFHRRDGVLLPPRELPYLPYMPLVARYVSQVY
jgi:hypothetical protein